MSALPKKITPERLKDTIVEVRYSASAPFDILFGQMYLAIKDSFSRTPNDSRPALLPLDFSNFFKLEIAAANNVFENDIIRLQLFDGRFVFNTNGAYQGWAVYFAEIKKIIKKLGEKGFLPNINWVGLRYVSEFEDVKIFENLKWKFDFSWKNAQSINTTFKTEWLDESDKMIVNLVNNAQRDQNKHFSLVDLDVNHAFSEAINYQTVLKKIEKLHQKEKKLFFGLMKPDFLQSLNPTF
jgi:uncharacterized protein (TIGR04255 family)